MSESTNTTPAHPQNESSGSSLFAELSPEERPTEIESYCVSCEKQGVTRLLLTHIPHYKSVILMAFNCPHCGLHNAEVQSGEEIQPYGVEMILRVTKASDLNRQIVKGDQASIEIKELEFTVPPNTQRGTLNTVEGFLVQAADQLDWLQSERRAADPVTAERLDQFISKLRDYSAGNVLPFTLVLYDPTGNSHIENPFAPDRDPQLLVKRFQRTRQQDVQLGIAAYEEESEPTPKPASNASNAFSSTLVADFKDVRNDNILEALQQPKEVMTFETVCGSCRTPGENRMLMVDIPYFKEVVIMSFVCEQCGFKSNEIKAGGAVPSQGKRLTLIVQDSKFDFSRDVLKSETATVNIPEIDLFLEAGTLGGKFTTVEGLLSDCYNALAKSPFTHGDSSDDGTRAKFQTFLTSLEEISTGKKLPFTLIIDDPVANSYIQNLCAPDPDPQLKEEHYDRTWEQNEVLGLNDIKTENYETIDTTTKTTTTTQ